METLTIILLVYVFLSFYFLFLFMLVYLQNREQVMDSPKANKVRSLSIVIPCFNGEENIGKTIENLLNSDYKGLKKIIAVDDCSTDNSYNVMKEYEKKYPDKVKVVQTPKNSGCAAGAKNWGAKYVDTELIGFTDDDSYPKEDAMDKMVGFFNDSKVGAVTSTVLVQNRNNFITKLQSIEYKVIKFSRKLLEFLDSIYVTPGPLAIYRKSSFDNIGGFDESNLTEDIEITWHLQKAGYKIKMAAGAKAYTIAPEKFKEWVKQRNRWNMGGIQTVSKYKNTFARHGMLGTFILPFFIFSWVVSIFGIFVLLYRFFYSLYINFLSATYSVQANTAIFRMSETSLSLDVLMFFGIIILSFTLLYTLIALTQLKEPEYKRPRIHSLVVYLFFYILMYPLILITSIFKYTIRQIDKKKHKW